ncbi:MAG TPA: beta-ketoacyl synthase N-terminal-like domain-containing protein, partial [Phycisphaerae bacterium]|nr:beta-ketoacyl synthase N-terminal-like domain-containing protein [Phycisphaerae bacterium]
MIRRVVVTGMGWITPLGHDIETAWKRLLEGESGIAKTTIFDAGTFPTQFSSEVKDFDLSKFLERPDYDRNQNASRQAKFALAAARMAWDDSGLAGKLDLDRTQVGVYLGGGEGPLDFDNFVAAAVDGWNYGDNKLDSVRWAEVALSRLTEVSEL